jgi:hypothetical protein
MPADRSDSIRSRCDDVAKKMIAALRAHQKKGAYDAIDDGYVFATQLTDHLQAVSHDKHLRVECNPMVLPKDGHENEDERPVAPEMRARMERDNCGFERAERLEFNIGYLKFDYFGNPEVCGPIATAAIVSPLLEPVARSLPERHSSSTRTALVELAKARIVVSAVTSEAPSRRAVAAMIRSEGSAWSQASGLELGRADLHRTGYKWSSPPWQRWPPDHLDEAGAPPPDPGDANRRLLPS